MTEGRKLPKVEYYRMQNTTEGRMTEGRKAPKVEWNII